jgi:hypothetical protein
MHIRVGNFQFYPWEATLSNVTIESRFSARKIRETKIVQMSIVGTVVADGAAAIGQRLEEIRQALAFDGKDVGLYEDDGTPTHHVLVSNDPYNMTGNQIHVTSFPSDAGAEYVSGRDFSFTVRAEIYAADTPLIYYREDYVATGDAGPRYSWEETLQGLIVRQVSPATIQHVVHSGTAVTYGAYLDVPPPFYGPPFHLSHLRRISKGGPERYPQMFGKREISWTYHYALPLDVNNDPRFR